MDIWKEVEKRFRKAISESVRPPVLIGPKWFRINPDSRRAPFQFVGGCKIAKGTGRPVEWVTEKLLEHVRLDDLGLEATIVAGGTINVAPAGAAEKDRASGKPRKES